MKPVFDKLEELDIPATGPATETERDDWTLVHELEAMFMDTGEYSDSQYFENDEAPPNSGSASDATPDDNSMPGIGPETTTDCINLSEILRIIGGHVQIDALMRAWIAVRGYKRAGKNIRVEFEDELHALKGQGAITVSGDWVSLEV